MKRELITASGIVIIVLLSLYVGFRHGLGKGIDYQRDRALFVVKSNRFYEHSFSFIESDILRKRLLEVETLEDIDALRKSQKFFYDQKFDKFKSSYRDLKKLTGHVDQFEKIYRMNLETYYKSD